jgi:hypothetical protein
MGGGVKLPESALLARLELVDILQYHVLPGMFTSSEGPSITTCCHPHGATSFACPLAGPRLST